jgi:ketosteroid isomerase-like protein
MYSWIIGRIVRLLYGKVSDGDLRLPLLGVANDACLYFPGTSSFGGEQRGKSAIERWLRRFASLQPEFIVDDAAAAGPPWNIRILMRFHDRIVTRNGYVYENAGMEYIRVKGGLIREIRVHLDTEKVAELDAQLGPADEAEVPRQNATVGP